jgi:hypothetical protein
LRQGGLQNILNKEEVPHLAIEELDYSELLRDEGEETKDIWVYLFKATVENNDAGKINEFADNFEKIIGKFNARDLFQDEELRQSLYNFLNYLKDKEKERFHNCTKNLLRFVLSGKNISEEEKFDKIRIFFEGLDNQALTETLLDGLSKDDNFNYLSFTVFSRLFDEDKHKAIAPTLGKEIKNAEFLKNNPKVRKKIKEMFSLPDSSFISPFYREALSWLSKESFLEDAFSFDYILLQEHYRFLLLNLLKGEKDIQSLSLISERLLKEWDKIVEENDLAYLKFLWETLEGKIKEDASFALPLEELESCISKFVENAAFEEEPLAGLEYFIDRLRKSSLGFDFYLNKIFKEGRVNPCILRLLLKFFPENLPLFSGNLEERYFDVEFLGKIAKGLGGIDSPLSLELLKKIFYFSNNIIKIEVLKAMQVLPRRDDEFLFSILDKAYPFLKKHALLALAREEEGRKTALEKLFSIPSPFGRKNKILIEHIAVIEDIDLKEAADYLVTLSKRRFFWNKNLRDRADSVLKKWNVKKD